MRKKLFTHGTTFFMTAEMYNKIKKVTDSLEVSVSDFIRGLIEEYLRKNSSEQDPNEKMPTGGNNLCQLLKD